MKSFAAVPLLGAAIAPACAALAPRQSNLQPVTVRGNAFYQGDERFYMRGVAYQPGGASAAADPLLDLDSLRRDVANFKDLGINTIRIYTIDNAQNHDEGMALLADAGIYLALDANTPDYSLNRETEDTLHRSYNDVYLQSVFATIDAFADYDNLLLFFSGNEVINDKNNSNAAPYVKAVTRDMKQYISNRHSRSIPVGYSAADVAEIIEQQALYFDCGSDDARADFFAFNDYSWCDFEDHLQTFEGAGWDAKVRTYANFPRPIFLSEHGCIKPNRQWGEVAALFSERMTGVYSGGLAYEYTIEENGYGIVDLDNGEVTPNEDFEQLKAAYANVTNPSGSGGARQSGSASECPSEDEHWSVTETNLPAMPQGAVKYMTEGAGTGPGLAGDGSQNAGGTVSSSTATPGSGQPSRTPDGSAAPSNTGGSTGGAAPAVDVPLRFLGMVGASVLLGAALML